jgi:hypothetical protein
LQNNAKTVLSVGALECGFLRCIKVLLENCGICYVAQQLNPGYDCS